jgi:transposase InsO family protein
VIAHPTAIWVWRQLIEATAWGRQPRSLVRDRDAGFGGDVVPRARRMAVETVLSPVRSPRANTIAGRIVRTLRSECLDHLIIVNERHLRAVLAEVVQYDNTERPYRTLALDTPRPTPRPAAGPVRSKSLLGGLHHVYERAN